MKKKKIIIFGSGSAAKVVFNEILNLNYLDIIGFVDSNQKKGKLVIAGKKNYYIVGSIEEWAKKKNLFGIVGVGFNFQRNKIVNNVNKVNKNFKWQSIISKNSAIHKDVVIGEGSVILSGSVINCGTKIGKHCRINTSSSIDHDNFFNDFSSCGPGIVTGGNVKIGESSFIGIGCVVKQKIKIGKNTVIGGNSFVNKDCADNCVYYGSPIKKIKKRANNEPYL